MFYEARPERLEKDVRSFLEASGAPEPRPAFGAIVPHAGYVYSGPVAGAVYARLAIPAVAVILCPNHTGRGAPAALETSDSWRTPLGDVPVNRRLSERLRELAPSLEPDAAAHAREHSLEVQPLPPSERRRDIEIVPCASAPTTSIPAGSGTGVRRPALGGERAAAPPGLFRHEPLRAARDRPPQGRGRSSASKRLIRKASFTTVQSGRDSMCISCRRRPSFAARPGRRHEARSSPAETAATRRGHILSSSATQESYLNSCQDRDQLSVPN
jgi:hypothetical protein